MNARPASVRLLFAALALLMLAGCASTKFRSTWRDEADGAGPPRRIAVFVAVKDDNLRMMAENRGAQSLPGSVNAVAGHQLGLDPALHEDEVRRRLAAQGFDAALVARVVSVDRSQSYVPPQTMFPGDPFIGPWGPRYSSFYAFYPWAYGATPGHFVDNTRVVIETLLYRLPEGRPVWTAVSETLNPESSAKLVDELIRLMLPRLTDAGLLPRP